MTTKEPVVTLNDAFWDQVEGEIRHGQRITDERGRLAYPKGTEMKAAAYGRWQFLNPTAKPSAFEQRFNGLLLASATEKVAKLKGAAEGFSTEMRKAVKAVEALGHAVSRLNAAADQLPAFRSALKAAGLPLAAEAIPDAGAIKTLADRMGPAVKGFGRRKDWFVDRVVSREDEILSWPAPSLDDLSTLYADVAQPTPTAEGEAA